MRAAKVQASLRIRAVSPEPSLLAHTSSESRGIFRQKARSLPPLNGWACAVKICHDGMLEDTNSLGGAQLMYVKSIGIGSSKFTYLFSVREQCVQFDFLSLTVSIIWDVSTICVGMKTFWQEGTQLWR